MNSENMKWLEITIEEQVAIITINLPPVNAFTEELLDALERVFDYLNQEQIAVIILTGKNGFFSAGADIKRFPFRNAEKNQVFFKKLYQVLNQIENCPIPVIAAINGYAVGAGLELALCADIRVAEESAKLGATGVNLGLVFCTQRLPRLIGYGRAKEMLFTARIVEATEAAQIGLVEQLVPPGTALLRAKDMAALITRKAPLAVKGVKHAMQAGNGNSLEEGLQNEAETLKQMLATKDFSCRVQKFLDKQ